MEIYNASINKEILDILNSFEYVDIPNFKYYDQVDINNDYITLYREPVYSRDENGDYYISEEQVYRRLKRNSMTGVFVDY